MKSATTVGSLYSRYLAAHNVEGLAVPMMAVKFYKHGEEIPQEVKDLSPEGLTLTSCQATRQALLGDSVLLTRHNIGCVAAAISLGLVDAGEDKPLQDNLVYTDIMRQSSGKGESFVPPSPRDFTEGTVYACTSAGRPEFALFGPADVGRFQDQATAKRAIDEMMAIQPATMQGVFFYSVTFDDLDIVPDVVLLDVRPVELTRLIQGYWFLTGERLNVSMGGLRAVNSDLIARPFLTGQINVSTYCLGARLIAEFGPDTMGVGMPFDKFRTVVEGMEASRTGYPFELYPSVRA